MDRYNQHGIEKKWREIWEKEKLYHTAKDPKKKYYCLDMFPYPSGDGLHVGHWRGYVLSDMWARYQKMNGYDVLHPIGFDAFGLPAENAAIKRKSHPRKFTAQAIPRMREQLKQIGTMYDWEREVVTSEPSYYKWTQKIFLELFKQGLAYRKNALVNWCPTDQTVLANEQVVEGKCERCGAVIEKQEREQWFFKITNYTEELLADLEKLNWPERVKTLQRNWIGKSEGALLSFAVEGSSEKIDVFTTRPDTLFGCTYLVLAPEHPAAEKITSTEHKKEFEAYRKTTNALSEVERIAEKREKTGVHTGAFALHPATKEKLPIFVADYVVMGYGTGAIMAVPAHDQRDFAFAKQYNIPLKTTIKPDDGRDDSKIRALEECFTGKGILYNSGDFTGLTSDQAIEKIGKKYGAPSIRYKLRDWLISRQRYWGAPIPIVYCDKCGIQAVSEKDLPVLLPEDSDFKPTGESPLARHPTFTNTICPNCDGSARRETDTMDTFVDSSWYFLRYTDPHNTKEAFSQKELNKWLPVDMYVGGIEHAILHLLYARFVTKALADAKLVGFREPFTRLYNIGIVHLDGAKMSKSRGNVVNPDELVAHFGSDTLRGYELFLGPADRDVEWNPRAVAGIHRFLERVWEISGNVRDRTDSLERTKELIFEITREIEALRPNTALARLMAISHDYVQTPPSKEEFAFYLQLMAPFFPHLAEDLWHTLGKKDSIFSSAWPQGEEHLGKRVTIVVQVNGKLRATVDVPRDVAREDLQQSARTAVEHHIQGKSLKKVIVVDGRLVNFVVQ
jgi:leucyl-tRNA synthetase